MPAFRKYILVAPHDDPNKLQKGLKSRYCTAIRMRAGGRNYVPRGTIRRTRIPEKEDGELVIEIVIGRIRGHVDWDLEESVMDNLFEGYKRRPYELISPTEFQKAYVMEVLDTPIVARRKGASYVSSGAEDRAELNARAKERTYGEVFDSGNMSLLLSDVSTSVSERAARLREQEEQEEAARLREQEEQEEAARHRDSPDALDNWNSLQNSIVETMKQGVYPSDSVLQFVTYTKLEEVTRKAIHLSRPDAEGNPPRITADERRGFMALPVDAKLTLLPYKDDELFIEAMKIAIHQHQRQGF